MQNRTLAWKTPVVLDLSEYQLLNAVRTGSEDAFETIFRRWYQPLCRYAWAFLREHARAEEVVQAAFLQIWEKREEIDIRTSLKSYLYRMVRNSCLNVIKHDKIRQRHFVSTMAAGEPEGEAVDKNLAANELETKIYSAMQMLPEQCRLVFQLSRFEDLRYAEIAAQLQISVKTVENQMGKALRIMREQLKDYLPILFFFLSEMW
ncbi:MAG: RNA polymerase sigma-70 factor [Cyclobacteriaceae bacterium]|nr:RNA polymerase sigma-70 factor [Cyclobacteriaceae bacterium]